MTISARRGGGNMSEKIYNGHVKFIHPNGYGFIVCDDSEIEDSYCHANVVELHKLEGDDEIEYSIQTGRGGKYEVDQVFLINGKEIEVKPKLDADKLPGKVFGTVTSISNAGNAQITLEDYHDSIPCQPKTVKKNKLSTGDIVEISLSPPKTIIKKIKGREDVEISLPFRVSYVFSINGEPVRDTVPRTIANLIKSAFNSNPHKKLTKLFLSFTSGGDDQEVIEVYAGAQESLKPFLDYATKSIQAAENQRKTLRFRWEEIKKPSKIIIKPNFTTIIVEVESYDYLTMSIDLLPNERFATELDNTLNRVTKVGKKTSEGLIPFSTEFPLENQGNWQRIQHNLLSLEYKVAESIPLIGKVSIGDSTRTILSQTREESALKITLEGTIEKKTNLLFDGEKVKYIFESQEGFSSLKDQVGNVILENGRMGEEIEIISLPSSENLFDQNLFPYMWKKQGSNTNKRTIKLTLHEDVQARLDLSTDDDPYDLIFSPNRELYNMEVEGKDFVAQQIPIFNRNSNTRTIQVKELPPDGSILTSAPRTRLIRAQRDMLEELMNHSLPHNEALLKLLAPGDLSKREELWAKSAPRNLKTEPEWVVLTENTDGTETQREMVRIALESRDISILQGPPGSGKSTTILEYVYQSILRGEKILLCGSTQASIDNVLGRIMHNPRLSEIISPVRIGAADNIYDEDIRKITLNEQKKKWVENFGFEGIEARDFILHSSNLTCGTMESILGHPWILEARREGMESRSTDSKVIKSPQPHWDVLIIDESSKTTFNEFIVPAMFCKKFVLVGDIRQLPPFTQEGEFIANLESINNFNYSDQRAMILHSQLLGISKPNKQDSSVMLVEQNKVVTRLLKEWSARHENALHFPKQNLTVVSSKFNSDNSLSSTENIDCYSPQEILDDDIIALRVMTSKIIVIDEDSLRIIEHLIPPMSTIWGPKTIESSFQRMNRRALEYRNHSSFKNHNITQRGGKKIVEIPEWSSEMSWRLTRLSELKISESNSTKQKYRRALDKITPESIPIKEEIELIQLIALPSVMECLQEGFRSKDESINKLQSTLTHGFPPSQFDEIRFKMLDWQHRMEPGISEFPREKYYEGKALKDANTITIRNQENPFTYRADEPSALWCNVDGREKEGANPGEIEKIRIELKSIINWARKNSSTDGKPWTVAILTPYAKQNYHLLQMVKELTGILDREFRFDLQTMQDPIPITLVVSSTDKYQGQEADIVLISLVKTSGHGFLDSWNRMNVALTRSKRIRIIFGKHNNFKRTHDEMLNDLAICYSGKSLISIEGE